MTTAPDQPQFFDPQPTKGQRKHECPTCGRRLRSLAGLHQHNRDKHGAR